MKTAIVKYNAGNIQSVLYALERLGVEGLVTDDFETIRGADRVIFPGVGEASTAMAYLRDRKLDTLITTLTQPVLGICLGMQLMCASSEENDTQCLGIFEEPVKKFRPEVPAAVIDPLSREIAFTDPPMQRAEKVPQIGWNNIYDLESPLFANVPEQSYIYLVHGYYASLGQHTIATANYIHPYSAALHKNNFYGVQFHPEKSAAVGEKILSNFLSFN
ncbi:MAG: imidazole glycerol phosphate synthase subunit HisH [Chitinophagaceae bacterium]